MVTNDDMVLVNGVQYRPEDVPGKGKAETVTGRAVVTGPVTPDDMVEVNGVLYRPEDVPTGAQVDAPKGRTSRPRKPRGKTPDPDPTPAPDGDPDGDGSGDPAPAPDGEPDPAAKTAETVTTKVAAPSNKARGASTKEG